MKNPTLKNLRVAVVPMNCNIDQSSDVEEILTSEHTTLIPVTDYFKAQNDEEFECHWSFLIDIEKKEDWTGSNLDGIHQFDRANQIDQIQSVIQRWGATTSTDLELDHSPCLNSIGNDVLNVSELVEEFKLAGVETITYQGENDLGYSQYAYEELPDDIITEIYKIISNYDVEMKKD